MHETFTKNEVVELLVNAVNLVVKQAGQKDYFKIEGNNVISYKWAFPFDKKYSSLSFDDFIYAISQVG